MGRRWVGRHWCRCWLVEATHTGNDCSTMSYCAPHTDWTSQEHTHTRLHTRALMKIGGWKGLLLLLHLLLPQLLLLLLVLAAVVANGGRCVCGAGQHTTLLLHCF